MRFDDIVSATKGIPYMEPIKGRKLYDFILREKPRDCLELGTFHGVSACYIAGALQELGRGKLVTVDLVGSETFKPCVEDLLARTGLGPFVEVVREVHSYTWFLKKEIERHSADNNCAPAYDFCFIDGLKDWTVDGLAFTLADKLLREGGWVLFDDYDWTVEAAATIDPWTVGRKAGLSADEAAEPPIAKIFELLVMQHPDYSEFLVQDTSWAWAHKVHSPVRVARVEMVTPPHVFAYRAALSAGKRLVRRFG
jgi:predicted O-methyltransferase YrrM